MWPWLKLDQFIGKAMRHVKLSSLEVYFYEVEFKIKIAWGLWTDGKLIERCSNVYKIMWVMTCDCKDEAFLLMWEMEWRIIMRLMDDEWSLVGLESGKFAQS